MGGLDQGEAEVRFQAPYRLTLVLWWTKTVRVRWLCPAPAAAISWSRFPTAPEVLGTLYEISWHGQGHCLRPLLLHDLAMA